MQNWELVTRSVRFLNESCKLNHFVNWISDSKLLLFSWTSQEEKCIFFFPVFALLISRIQHIKNFCILYIKPLAPNHSGKKEWTGSWRSKENKGTYSYSSPADLYLISLSLYNGTLDNVTFCLTTIEKQSHSHVPFPPPVAWEGLSSGVPAHPLKLTFH